MSFSHHLGDLTTMSNRVCPDCGRQGPRIITNTVRTFELVEFNGTLLNPDGLKEAIAVVEGVEESLPNPHDPLLAIDRLSRLDGMTIAERVAELGLDDETHDVLWAELESLAHAPLEDAGAVSVLRWHALSGGSLELTQYTGGRVTLAAFRGLRPPDIRAFMAERRRQGITGHLPRTRIGHRGDAHAGGLDGSPLVGRQ